MNKKWQIVVAMLLALVTLLSAAVPVLAQDEEVAGLRLAATRLAINSRSACSVFMGGTSIPT